MKVKAFCMAIVISSSTPVFADDRNGYILEPGKSLSLEWLLDILEISALSAEQQGFGDDDDAIVIIDGGSDYAHSNVGFLDGGDDEETDVYIDGLPSKYEDGDYDDIDERWGVAQVNDGESTGSHHSYGWVSSLGVSDNGGGEDTDVLVDGGNKLL